MVEFDHYFFTSETKQKPDNQSTVLNGYRNLKDKTKQFAVYKL